MPISTLSTDLAQEDHGRTSAAMRPSTGVVLALMLAVMASVVVWSVPLFPAMTSDGFSRLTTLTRAPVREVAGVPMTAIVTGVPLLLVGLAFAWPRLRMAAGVTLLALCAAGAMSVGVLYLPAALALLIRAKQRPA